VYPSGPNESSAWNVLKFAGSADFRI
jgi:hypothetical protein